MQWNDTWLTKDYHAGQSTHQQYSEYEGKIEGIVINHKHQWTDATLHRHKAVHSCYT